MRVTFACIQLTQISVLNVPPRLLLEFGDVHGLLGEVANEHFLKLQSIPSCDKLGGASTVATVITKAPLLEH